VLESVQFYQNVPLPLYGVRRSRLSNRTAAISSGLWRRMMIHGVVMRYLIAMAEKRQQDSFRRKKMNVRMNHLLTVEPENKKLG
jgi:hypothetical protein